MSRRQSSFQNLETARFALDLLLQFFENLVERTVVVASGLTIDGGVPLLHARLVVGKKPVEIHHHPKRMLAIRFGIDPFEFAAKTIGVFGREKDSFLRHVASPEI